MTKPFPNTASAPADARASVAPLGLLGIHDTDDLCRYERSAQPWEVIGTPIGRGQFRVHKVFVTTPNCLVYRESCATRLHLQALSPEGMLACAVPLKLGSHSSYFRRSLHERGLPATLPTGLEAVLDQGQEHLLLLLRLSLLRRVLPPAQAGLLEAGAAAQVLPASSATLRALGRWLNGFLARVHSSPEMLRHPAAVVALERELVLGLAARILPTGPDIRPEPESRRRRGYDQAIELIRYADLDALNLPDLCAASGVSPRTLDYAFREHLGMSPGAFVRKLRLHALRRALLASDAGESTVTELAYHLGFTHLGRLATHYRQTFGELPSATLARPFPGDYPPFWTGDSGGGTRAAVVNTFP
jgi:AraC-like DNA-binding protein